MKTWAAGLDLRLMNQGSIATCVRRQGESVAGLTWAIPSATLLVFDYRFAEVVDIYILSDHRHIIFNVVPWRSRTTSSHRDSNQQRHCCMKRLNRDLPKAAANVGV